MGIQEGTFDYRDVPQGWEVTADGALMPARLADRGARGWLDDADRDSGKAAQLAEHVRDMDALVRQYRDGQHSDQFMAAQAAHLWTAIRKLTQEGAAQ